MNFLKRMPSSFQRRKVTVSSKSHRRYWAKSLEAIHNDIFTAVERWVCKDSVIWDVGANLGIFAFAAAVRAGPGGFVYAFEPDLEMAALMVRSMSAAIQNEAEVCVCPFAVGSREGEARFVVSGYRSAASALDGFGRFGRNKNDRERAVPIQTIDSLARSLRAPTLIKIDVEGAENLVLEGAEGVIRSCRPILLIEASGGQTGVRTVEMLRSWNYILGPLDDADGMSSDQTGAAGDIVAIHSDLDPRRGQRDRNV
jgi:FkbM family methyltransferase